MAVLWANFVGGESTRGRASGGLRPAEETLRGEWFYIRNPVEAPFPASTDKRPEGRESWSWGPSHREKKKVEIIEAEL